MPRGTQLILASFLSLTVGTSVPLPYQKSSQTSEQQTFRSPDGTSQFTYASSYTLYAGSEAEQPALSYIPVCQSAVACVVYPRSRYAGTNFQAAAFQEREIDEATTENACLTSPMRAPNVPEFYTCIKDPTRIINGVKFLHGSSFSFGMGNYMNTDLYRNFHKSRCYELSINVATSAFWAFDPGAVKEFTPEDEQHVRNELTTVLDSFRFLK
jgi:hypothetical protein